jgi:hypothetical protein
MDRADLACSKWCNCSLFVLEDGGNNGRILTYFAQWTERTWLDQGGVVGENVVPLARNFGSAELDIEAEAILGKVCI